MDEQNNIDLLTRVAWLYYYEDLSHQEIAGLLGLSRIKVTRLLKIIRDKKLVEIKIKNPCWSILETEKKLKLVTSLQSAIVVPSGKDPSVHIARAAARRLQELCSCHERIGIGAGRALSRTVEVFEPLSGSMVREVVSLLGNTMPNLALNPYALGLMLTNKLKVDFFNIWAPAVASSAETAAVYKKDYIISKVLEMASTVEAAILGIGDIRSTVMLTRGFISAREAEEIGSCGAVGEILGRFFDLEGRRIPTILEDRVIAVQMPMKCPVTAVAYGEEKVAGIAGAIRGNLIQDLITDEITARKLIAIFGKTKGSPEC